MRDELVTRVMARLVGLDDEQRQMVERVLVECISDYEVQMRQTAIVPAESFVPEWFGIFIAKKMLSGRAMGTVKLYSYYLMDFFLHKPAPIEEMDTSLMMLYLYDVQRRKGICNNTLERIRITLNVFFGWALNEGYVSSNFVSNIDPIKYVEKPRNPLTEEEEIMLRDACESCRDRAIIDVFLSTGVRISELVNIKWGDIDFQSKTIRIFGKGSKYRTVFFNAKTKVSLLKYKLLGHGDSEYVFVSERSPYSPIGKGCVHKVIKTLAKKSGVKSNVSAHVLRHTFATRALSRGMSLEKLKELLGHESCDTTLIYAQIEMNQVDYEYRRAFGG